MYRNPREWGALFNELVVEGLDKNKKYRWFKDIFLDNKGEKRGLGDPFLLQAEAGVTGP